MTEWPVTRGGFLRQLRSHDGHEGHDADPPGAGHSGGPASTCQALRQLVQDRAGLRPPGRRQRREEPRDCGAHAEGQVLRLRHGAGLDAALGSALGRGALVVHFSKDFVTLKCEGTSGEDWDGGEGCSLEDVVEKRKGGVGDVCIKTGPIRCPNGKFRCFPRWSLWSGGGGGWHKALVVGSVSLWRRLLASRL